jgi:hypothetical protein
MNAKKIRVNPFNPCHPCAIFFKEYCQQKLCNFAIKIVDELRLLRSSQ